MVWSCVRKFASAVIPLVLALQCGMVHAECKMLQFLTMPITMSGYKAIVTVQLNGMEAHLMIDTGASFSILSPAAAKRMGLGVTPATITLIGVGGQIRPGVTDIKDFKVGTQTVHHMEMLVYGDQFSSGDIDGILGQNLMRVGDMEIDLAHGVAHLFKDTGCQDSNLAYWHGSDPVSVLRLEHLDMQQPNIIADVYVDDRRMQAVFDTGAGFSTLSLDAAGRIGVTPRSPGVTPGGIIFGVGKEGRDSWIAPFKSFRLDQEQIANTHLRITDTYTLPKDSDMLLGADFFLSHRVLISYELRKIFFTYNGGPVFDLSTRREDRPATSLPAESSASGAALPPDSAQNAAAGAADIDRQATAEVERNELPAAIADFGRAIAADSSSALYRLHRGQALLRARQPQQAMLDIEEALRLQPALTDALMVRAQYRIRSGNLDGGRADFAAAEASAPGRYDLVLIESDTYAATGRYPVALQLLTGWIAAHPDDARYYLALASRCQVRGMMGTELEGALDDCNSAGRRLSNNSQLLYDRGIVELRLKQYDKAITDFSDTIKLQPQLARAFYARGIARIAKGDKPAGNADLKTALDMNPGLARVFHDVGLGP